MTPFPARLKAEFVDGHHWLVISPFKYVRPNGTVITVPAGFLTDLASIPRPFWPILPPGDDYGEAAVIHDWLYFAGGLERAEADRIFLEAMIDAGVGWLRRRTIYRMVRLFGGKVWERRRWKDKAK